MLVCTVFDKLSGYKLSRLLKERHQNCYFHVRIQTTLLPAWATITLDLATISVSNSMRLSSALVLGLLTMLNIMELSICGIVHTTRSWIENAVIKRRFTTQCVLYACHQPWVVSFSQPLFLWKTRQALRFERCPRLIDFLEIVTRCNSPCMEGLKSWTDLVTGLSLFKCTEMRRKYRESGKENDFWRGWGRNWLEIVAGSF